MPASPTSVDPVDEARSARPRPRARRRRRRLHVVDLLVGAVVASLATGFAGARRLGLFPRQPAAVPVTAGAAPTPAPTAVPAVTASVPVVPVAPVGSAAAPDTPTTVAPAVTTTRPIAADRLDPDTSRSVVTVASAPVAFAVPVPSQSAPVHMLVVGDALADGLAKGLTRIGAANGNLVVRSRVAATSGLARPEVFDWPAQLASLVAPDDELVVVVLGLNDAQPLSRSSHPADDVGSEAWSAEYQNRVRRLVEGAGPRPVLLVGLPVVETAARDKALAPVRAALAAEADRHANVRFLDLYPITSDAGHFLRYFDLGDGQQIPARSNDGEHFTDAGNDLVAGATMNAIWPDRA